MDWNREVDRAIISEVSMDDILQIKREHITEPVKRSIERYGNKPEMLSLILNMAIAELVLLITKVLEAIKGIHSRLQRENAPEDKNKAQKQDNGILTVDALPPEPVMTPLSHCRPSAPPLLRKAASLGHCPALPSHLPHQPVAASRFSADTAADICPPLPPIPVPLP